MQTQLEAVGAVVLRGLIDVATVDSLAASVAAEVAQRGTNHYLSSTGYVLTDVRHSKSPLRQIFHDVNSSRRLHAALAGRPQPSQESQEKSQEY